MSQEIGKASSASKPVRALARTRQETMLRELRRTGSLRVRDISRDLGVSAMTARRDIDVLVEDGLADRTHGGVVLPDRDRVRPNATEPSFESKTAKHQTQKMAIAEAAARMVEPGSAIALTGGTTTATLASNLAAISDLVVVTNSMPVAARLQRHPGRNHTIILTGGATTPSAALVGPIAERAIEAMHIDKVFMGVHGMSERAGYTTPNILEASTNQAFINSAEEVVVVADASKWQTVGLSVIAPLRRADTVISDEALPTEAQVVLSKCTNLHLATRTGSAQEPAKSS